MSGLTGGIENRIIKQERRLHVIIYYHSRTARFTRFTRRLVGVLNSTTWFMVVHVKRALVSRKKGKEYFLEKLILRFDKYSFLSFSDFSFFSYKNRF